MKIKRSKTGDSTFSTLGWLKKDKHMHNVMKPSMSKVSYGSVNYQLKDKNTNHKTSIKESPFNNLFMYITSVQITTK